MAECPSYCSLQYPENGDCGCPEAVVGGARRRGRRRTTRRRATRRRTTRRRTTRRRR